jgi:hypothetical protein
MSASEKIKFLSGDVMRMAGYEETAAYHGGRYPAGTALGFKAMDMAQNVMFPEGGAFIREKCSVETSFMGEGFRDAVEMVLRCVSRGAYHADPEMPVPDNTPPAPGGGKFFYRFKQCDGFAELTVKPGLVPEEFYEATEELHSGRAESEERCLSLRRTIEKTLLSLAPSEIFEIRGGCPCRPAPDCNRGVAELEDEFTVKLNDFGIFDVTLEDARLYHGEESLCGVCLAWSLVRQWISLTASSISSPLPRREIVFESAADGSGIDDAFEYIFRTSSGARKSSDITELRAPEVFPGAGRFAFGLSIGGNRATRFALKNKMVPKDYLRLCGMRSATEGAFEKQSELRELQLEFARAMLAEEEPFDVCDVG